MTGKLAALQQVAGRRLKVHLSGFSLNPFNLIMAFLLVQASCSRTQVRILSLPFLIGIIIFPAFCGAAAIPPLQGLEQARRSFSGVVDFTAEITQEKQIALMKRKLFSNGLVRFKRPDLFYMEVFSPYPSRLLLQDNTLTMTIPSEGIRQKSTLPSEEGLLHWFRLLDRPLERLPDGLEVRADKSGGVLTLWITPKEKKGVKEIRISMLDDGRPKSISIEERNNDRTVITFRKVRKNTGIAADDFKIE